MPVNMNLLNSRCYWFLAWGFIVYPTELHNLSRNLKLKKNTSTINTKSVLQLLQVELNDALKQAGNSGLKYHATSSWSQLDTLHRLSSLPEEAHKLSLVQILRMLIKQNGNFSFLQKAMANKERKQMNECKLSDIGQFQHMVEGNVWSQVDVPWVRFVLYDLWELWPKYEDDLDDQVQKFMSRIGWLSTTTKLSDCGWTVVDAECVHETKKDGNRVFKKCQNENIVKSLASYNRDRIMLLTNKKGTHSELFPPNACVLLTNYMNDLLELDKYTYPERDVKLWKENNKSRLDYENTKTWRQMTSESSNKTHRVLAMSFHELRVVRQTRTWKKLKQMMIDGKCSKVIFTGFSLGGTVAELLRVDLGLADENGQYTPNCVGGVPCIVINLSGSASFPSSTAPEIKEDARDHLSCSKGSLIKDLKDTALTMEGDLEPIRLNAYFLGYDIFPKGKGMQLSLRDLGKAWPQEPGGYTNIKGMTIAELRRNLIFKMKDGKPKADACVFQKIAPCGFSMWQYYNSQQYVDRMQKIRKPIEIAVDGSFYFCPGDASNRYCGHRPYAFQYWESVQLGVDQSCDDGVPMAEGSHLHTTWLAFQAIKGILS